MSFIIMPATGTLIQAVIMTTNTTHSLACAQRAGEEKRCDETLPRRPALLGPEHSCLSCAPPILILIRSTIPCR